MSERRVPKYLSPSAISLFRKDPEEYYVRYCAAAAPGDSPQTQAMSIGSAFDAYAKSYLHEKLFGRGHDPMYEFTALFEAQVQEQWRDWAKLHGMYVFDGYTKSGALGDLLTELQQAVNKPVFEITVTGVINNQREPVSREMGGDITFMGKPDVLFINKHGAHVILDWKVNGYCSSNPVSPMAGYVRLRGDYKKTGNAHPDCVLVMHHGVMINSRASLSDFNVDWATQLSIYAWLGGLEIGGDFIAGIDQVCCAPAGEFPKLRFAEHRMRISPTFQRSVFALAQNIWQRAHSDHFFTDMSFDESKIRCEMLDNREAELAKMDPAFLAMTQSRPHFPKKA